MSFLWEGRYCNVRGCGRLIHHPEVTGDRCLACWEEGMALAELRAAYGEGRNGGVEEGRTPRRWAGSPPVAMSQRAEIARSGVEEPVARVPEACPVSQEPGRLRGLGSAGVDEPMARRSLAAEVAQRAFGSWRGWLFGACFLGGLVLELRTGWNPLPW